MIAHGFVYVVAGFVVRTFSIYCRDPVYNFAEAVDFVLSAFFARSASRCATVRSPEVRICGNYRRDVEFNLILRGASLSAGECLVFFGFTVGQSYYIPGFGVVYDYIFQ